MPNTEECPKQPSTSLTILYDAKTISDDDDDDNDPAAWVALRRHADLLPLRPHPSYLLSIPPRRRSHTVSHLPQTSPSATATLQTRSSVFTHIPPPIHFLNKSTSSLSSMSSAQQPASSGRPQQRLSSIVSQERVGASTVSSARRQLSSSSLAFGDPAPLEIETVASCPSPFPMSSMPSSADPKLVVVKERVSQSPFPFPSLCSSSPWRWQQGSSGKERCRSSSASLRPSSLQQRHCDAEKGERFSVTASCRPSWSQRENNAPKDVTTSLHHLPHFLHTRDNAQHQCTLPGDPHNFVPGDNTRSAIYVQSCTAFQPQYQSISSSSSPSNHSLDTQFHQRPVNGSLLPSPLLSHPSSNVLWKHAPCRNTVPLPEHDRNSAMCSQHCGQTAIYHINRMSSLPATTVVRPESSVSNAEHSRASSGFPGDKIHGHFDNSQPSRSHPYRFPRSVLLPHHHQQQHPHYQSPHPHYHQHHRRHPDGCHCHFAVQQPTDMTCVWDNAKARCECSDQVLGSNTQTPDHHVNPTADNSACPPPGLALPTSPPPFKDDPLLGHHVIEKYLLGPASGLRRMDFAPMPYARPSIQRERGQTSKTREPSPEGDTVQQTCQQQRGRKSFCNHVRAIKYQRRPRSFDNPTSTKQLHAEQSSVKSNMPQLQTRESGHRQNKQHQHTQLQQQKSKPPEGTLVLEEDEDRESQAHARMKTEMQLKFKPSTHNDLSHIPKHKPHWTASQHKQQVCEPKKQLTACEQKQQLTICEQKQQRPEYDQPPEKSDGTKKAEVCGWKAKSAPVEQGLERAAEQSSVPEQQEMATNGKHYRQQLARQSFETGYHGKQQQLAFQSAEAMGHRPIRRKSQSLGAKQAIPPVNSHLTPTPASDLHVCGILRKLLTLTVKLPSNNSNNTINSLDLSSITTTSSNNLLPLENINIPQFVFLPLGMVTLKPSASAIVKGTEKKANCDGKSTLSHFPRARKAQKSVSPLAQQQHSITIQDCTAPTNAVWTVQQEIQTQTQEGIHTETHTETQEGIHTETQEEIHTETQEGIHTETHEKIQAETQVQTELLQPLQEVYSQIETASCGPQAKLEEQGEKGGPQAKLEEQGEKGQEGKSHTQEGKKNKQIEKDQNRQKVQEEKSKLTEEAEQDGEPLNDCGISLNGATDDAQTVWQYFLHTLPTSSTHCVKPNPNNVGFQSQFLNFIVKRDSPKSPQHDTPCLHSAQQTLATKVSAGLTSEEQSNTGTTANSTAKPGDEISTGGDVDTVTTAVLSTISFSMEPSSNSMEQSSKCQLDACEPQIDANVKTGTEAGVTNFKMDVMAVDLRKPRTAFPFPKLFPQIKNNHCDRSSPLRLRLSQWVKPTARYACESRRFGCKRHSEEVLAVLKRPCYIRLRRIDEAIALCSQKQEEEEEEMDEQER